VLPKVGKPIDSDVLEWWDEVVDEQEEKQVDEEDEDEDKKRARQCVDCRTQRLSTSSEGGA
jgi:hypothetical protein